MDFELGGPGEKDRIFHDFEQSAEIKLQDPSVTSELRVGEGWRYRCWACNYQVGIATAFPETCPGCGRSGWWGHLTTVADNGTLGQKTGDGANMENLETIMPAGIKTRNVFLSQAFDAVGRSGGENEGIPETSPARDRGRPRRAVPEGLILELAGQGLGSRQIAADLEARGFHMSYKSIQRYFKRQKQGALI